MPRLKKKSEAQKLKERKERNRKHRESEKYEEDKAQRRDQRQLDRQNDSVREQENAERAERLAAARRRNPEFYEEDLNRRREAHRLERAEHPEVRYEENRDRAQRMESARLNPEFRQQDMERSRNAHRGRRQEHPEVRYEENHDRAQRMEAARLNPDFRQQDLERRRNAHRVARQEHPEVRYEENHDRVMRMETARLNPEFRQQDMERSRNAHRERRQKHPEVRYEENHDRVMRMETARLNPEFRQQDMERSRNAHRERRQKHPEVCYEENHDRVMRMESARLNSEFHQQDLERRRNAHRIERQEHPEVRQEENEERTARIMGLGNTPVFQQHQIARRQNNQEQETGRRRLEFDDADDTAPKRKCSMYDSFEKNLAVFNSLISQGPVYICSCCGGLFYFKSTRPANREKLLKWGCTDMVINQVLHVQQSQHRLCITCHENIRKTKKVPRVCLSNGLDFPPIPNELQNLNRLEERLVSLRLPFMIICLKGYDRQWAIRGNIVNVENNMDLCVNSLPRRFNEAGVVQVALRRRQSDKNAYLLDKISPAKVLRATKVLLDKPLYKKHNVVMTENWDTFQSYYMDFIVDPTDEVNPVSNDVTANEDNDDEDTEVEQEDNPPIQETLVFNEDYSDKGIPVAPGEGRIPIPLCHDPDAERLSFPTVYCGEEEPTPAERLPGRKLTYTDIAKSELRRYDRRAAKPEKVLYSYRKSCNEKLRNAYSICLRQTRKGTTTGRVKAGDVRNKEGVSNIIANNDGYSVYSQVRSTPAYWQGQQKRLVAKVRQLGRSTLFVTLSAAETKWNELLVILTKVLRKKDITPAEAANLPREEKSRLISSDPVTCMRHFDNKYKALLNQLFKKENGVFEPHRVGDYYSRVEFQMRGSPHSHGLYWIPDAPEYDPDCLESQQEVIDFIDKYITCKRDEEGEMSELIKVQIHNHSDTCKKGRNKTACRFNFPKPPMPETVILKPLPEDTSNREKERLSQVYKKIQKKLTEFGRKFKDDIPFSEFLDQIDVDEETYYAAVRSTIERDTVFLKRRTCDIYVNNYNKRLLLAWRANMDIQFVLDAYACAKYCASYIVKSDPGVSKLLKAIMRDAKNGNKSAVECLKRFAQILMTRTEMSAQEAVAYLLGLPLTFSSRGHIYINTAEPEKRVGILRSKKELDELPDESEDVCQKGLLDYYVKRPDSMKNVCLADFASLYQYHKGKPGKKSTTLESEDENEEIDFVHEDEDDPTQINETTFPLKDGMGYVTRRRLRKIIRFRHFNKSDQVQYFREQLMLFLPWEDEERDLLQVDPISKYEEYKETVLNNAKPYYHNRNLDDGVLGAYIHELETLEEDNVESERVGNEMELLEEEQQAAAYLDSTRGTKSVSEKFLLPKMVESDEFQAHMQSLNVKQRNITYHILHRLKERSDPFHIFLTGGAGVGKSHVITAIVQSFLRYCNKRSDFDPAGSPVLVCAPTGKAAFNVFGMTLHSAFNLPNNQSAKNMGPLDEGLANTLRLKLKDLRLLIIDEISMVSYKQLMLIDQRLRQIFNSSLPFGGISVLVVGHLRQLPPFAGGSSKFIFKSNIPPLRNTLWELFKFFELDEIMRQRGEMEFCKALNNMSEGTMDDDDIGLMESREITRSLQPPEDAIWLFKTNAECDAHNDALHSRMKTERAISIAFDEVVGDASVGQRAKLLRDAKKWKRTDCDGIPYECKLQVGALYFVTSNVDVPDGLFNGATGILRKIDYGKTASGIIVPKRAWLEFNHILIGSKARGQLISNPNTEVGSENWTPIDRVKKALSKSYKCAGMTLYRENLPLAACNGMTIAKSQGSSLQSVVVCTRTKLQRAEFYVACSRATSRNGLFIDGEFTPTDYPGDNDDVSIEMRILRQNPVKFGFEPFLDRTKRRRIYFQNVRSFPKYRKDLMCDRNIMESTHVLLVEPHVLESYAVSLPTFELIARQNSQLVNNSTNSVGYLLFSKAGFSHHNQRTVGKQEGQKHYVITSFEIDDCTVVVCYKHPKYSNSVFLKDLEAFLRDVETSQMVVVGDLNINMSEREEVLTKFFDQFNMQNQLGNAPTTDLGSQIDVCFAKQDAIQACIYDTYISDHSGICISW